VVAGSQRRRLRQRPGHNPQPPAENVPSEGAEPYRLTRFVIFCCAADAEALQGVVHGDVGRRGRDQWLEMGRAVAAETGGRDRRPPNPPPPALTVDAVRPVSRPHRPYEYSLQYDG
jgi:uncharacterized membrane protein YcgQ (UPF0703/DUF1980 family)